MSSRTLLSLLIFSSGLVLGVILSIVFFMQQRNVQDRFSDVAYSRSLGLRMRHSVIRKRFNLDNMESRKFLFPEYLTPERPVPLDRPAYLRQEYSVRKTVFVGVLSSQMYLPTRAKAMYDTWASDVSMLVFFVGEDCIVPPELAHLPIIKLRGIPDNVYPPLKKAFAVIQYMCDHFVNDYNWFIRADDDSYMRGEKLMEVLNSMDSTEIVSLGRGGLGKDEDMGRLRLLKHERYCMGGPGMIFSRALMLAMGPYLNLCLEAIIYHNRLHPQLPWNDDDVEIGRCISRELDVQCSTSHEGRIYFYTDYDGGGLDTKTLWTKPEFREAITIHPIKDPTHIRALHLFYRTLDYKDLFFRKQAMERALTSVCKDLPPDLVPPSLLKVDCDIELSASHSYDEKPTLRKKKVHQRHVGKRL